MYLLLATTHGSCHIPLWAALSVGDMKLRVAVAVAYVFKLSVADYPSVFNSWTRRGLLAAPFVVMVGWIHREDVETDRDRRRPGLFLGIATVVEIITAFLSEDKVRYRWMRGGMALSASLVSYLDVYEQDKASTWPCAGVLVYGTVSNLLLFLGYLKKKVGVIGSGI